jgi:hypothetical protein
MFLGKRLSRLFLFFCYLYFAKNLNQLLFATQNPKEMKQKGNPPLQTEKPRE